MGTIEGNIEGNKELIQAQKKISLRAMGLFALMSAFLLFAGQTAIAKGLLLGTCFSVLNFILMGIISPVTLGQTRRKASMIAFCSIIARYALLAIPLILAVKSPSLAFVGVAVGLFAVQIEILLEHMAKVLGGET